MKGTRISLGGKERELRYDLNAIAEIGDRLGLTIRLAHFQEDLMDAPLSLSAVRTVLWAGLIHAEPDLTEKEVGAWVDQDNITEVFVVFSSLFTGTSPEIKQQIREKFGLESEAEDTKKPKAAVS